MLTAIFRAYMLKILRYFDYRLSKFWKLAISSHLDTRIARVGHEMEEAGAELCQAKFKLEVMVDVVDEAWIWRCNLSWS